MNTTPLIHAHECDYHGWDGPCLKPCRADDRYLADDGRILYLCRNHRSPKRMDTNTYVERTKRVACKWIGAEAMAPTIATQPVTTLPATGNNPQDGPSVALMALVLVAGTLGIYKLLRSLWGRLGVVGDAPEGWDI